MAVLSVDCVETALLIGGLTYTFAAMSDVHTRWLFSLILTPVRRCGLLLILDVRTRAYQNTHLTLPVAVSWTQLQADGSPTSFAQRWSPAVAVLDNTVFVGFGQDTVYNALYAVSVSRYRVIGYFSHDVWKSTDGGVYSSSY